jgi:hypothetical protein
MGMSEPIAFLTLAVDGVGSAPESASQESLFCVVIIINFPPK